MNKIVIIDDHQLFLYGLKLTLENEGNRVTTFDSPFKALPELKFINPDLILIDLYMPDANGVVIIDALKKASITSPIVVLSAYEGYRDVYKALQSGAKGFIPKSYSPQELLEALDKILTGELFVPNDIMLEIESFIKLEEKNKLDFNLSDRQIQILRLLQAGKKNREIAEELCIALDTVKFHQKGLYLALDVSGSSSRFKAVEKAISIGLLKAQY